jgi:hypothetical protein
MRTKFAAGRAVGSEEVELAPAPPVRVPCWEALALAAASRRASEAQVLEDAERLIAAWTSVRKSECRFDPHFHLTVGAYLVVFYVLAL